MDNGDNIEIPSKHMVTALLVRKLRYNQLNLGQNAGQAIYDHVIDYLAELYEAQTFKNVQLHLDERLDLIVATLLQITKDQRNVSLISSELIQQALVIILNLDSRHRAQQVSNFMNNDTSAVNFTNPMNNDDNVDLAIKYATLNQIQPTYILDPFNMAQYQYSTDSNQYFVENSLQTKRLHSGPIQYTKMFTDRYQHIYNRALRQEKSSESYSQRNNRSTHHNNYNNMNKTDNSAIIEFFSSKLYHVDSLRGQNGVLTVFGYLSEIVGEIFLESPSAQIKLNLSKAVLVDLDAIYNPQFQLKNAQVSGSSNNLTTAQRFNHGNKDNSQDINDDIDAFQQNTKKSNHCVSKHSIYSKLYTINTFVLVIGTMDPINGSFNVSKMALPSHESPQVTLQLFPSLQYVFPKTDYISYPNQQYHMISTSFLNNNSNNNHDNNSNNSNNNNDKQQKDDKSKISTTNITIKDSILQSSSIDVETFTKNQTLLNQVLSDTNFHFDLTNLNSINAMVQNRHKNHLQDRIIVLGEVYLHDPTTISHLQKLFSLLEPNPPQFIIFTGNYISPSYYIQNRYQPYLIKALFDQVADVIYSFKQLRTNTHFVFVVGTFDHIHGGDVLPLPPLQPALTSKLEKTITKVTFASNLLDIRYFGRKIKVFRGDIYTSIYHRDTTSILDDNDDSEQLRDEEEMKKQQSNVKTSSFDQFSGDENEFTSTSIKKSNNKTKLKEHLSESIMIDDNNYNNDHIDITHQIAMVGDITVKYITSQSTLLTDYSKVKWDFAQAYALFSLPDLLLLIDAPESNYSVSKHGCTFCNIGAFTGSWNYVEYFPATNTLNPGNTLL